MPFILIAKAADGQLRLLTESSFASRGEALTELSRITADPSFDRWDDEVLALDLDTGTPVLLVRPADKAAGEVEEPQEAAVTEDEEPVEESAEVDEVPAESEEESETAFAAEADEDEEGDTSEAEEQDEQAPSLKDALKRTTVQLEAEGIVAPESVGPAPAETEGETEVAGDGPGSEEVESADVGQPTAAWPWATAQEEKKFDLDALEAPGNDEGSLVRAPGDDETMSFARPVIMGAYDEETVAEAPAEPIIEQQPEPETEPEPVPAPEAEAEPAPEPEVEAESAVEPEPQAAEDTGTPGEIEFAPEVPLEAMPAEEDVQGAAGEPAPVSDSMGAADASTDDALNDLLADVSASQAEPLAAAESSDFVDLGPATPTPPIDTMTCDDCVYTESCPNKGQMAPASCGSFQWK